MPVHYEFDETKAANLLRAAGFQVLAAAAEKIKAEAVRLAPEDTGELKRSAGIAMSQDGDTMKAIVYFAAPYAPFVEFGHYTYIDRPKPGPAPKRATWVPPHPFMRPAITIAQAEFPSLVSQVNVNTVAKIEGGHYYASPFVYSRPEFERQYAETGYPIPGPSE